MPNHSHCGFNFTSITKLMMASAPIKLRAGFLKWRNSVLLLHCLSAGELTNLPALFTCHLGATA